MRLMLAGALVAVLLVVGAAVASGAISLSSAAPPAQAAVVAPAVPEATPSEAERAAAQLQLQAEESQYCQCGK